MSLSLSTGLNYARRLSATPFELTEDRLAKLKRGALALVTDGEGRGRSDAQEVGRRLRAAAAWGDEALVRTLLETCWVTPSLALPALAEAAKSGHEAVVAALIEAGADGTYPVSDAAKGKSALHFAWLVLCCCCVLSRQPTAPSHLDDHQPQHTQHTSQRRGTRARRKDAHQSCPRNRARSGLCPRERGQEKKGRG